MRSCLLLHHSAGRQPPGRARRQERKEGQARKNYVVLTRPSDARLQQVSHVSRDSRDSVQDPRQRAIRDLHE